MIKLLWVFIGINIIGLVIFIAAYFILNNGRNVDTIEKGWTFILAALGLLVILLAAVPLRISQSTVSLVFAGFFALLPSAIAIGIIVSKRLPKKKSSFATTYYKDKMQIKIASAIEKNDTVLLKELIKGQDLNIQGIKVWDWPGLNYLQFAVRLRSNPANFPFNDEMNTAAIRILIANGCATTPALAEATKLLSPGMIVELITAGADPNTRGFVNPNPLLFETLGGSEKENDITILLLRHGANANAKYDDGSTLVMLAAYRAGTTPSWADAWRLVRYLLEEAHADYTSTSANGNNLAGIIKKIQVEAAAKKITMPDNFNKVVVWLKQHHVDTGIE